MAWETRPRGGLYYTRSRRIAGRVTREYLGGGAVAHLAALLDERERDEREAARERERERWAQVEAADDLIDTLCYGSDTLAKAALVLAGYHQHDRGDWRKRRGESRAADGRD